MGRHYNLTVEKEKRRILRQEQTHCEKLMWMQLRNRQLYGYKFRRQYSVDACVIDFYCPQVKLAIELDGSIHENQQQKDYDIERQYYLENFRIHFIRIKNEEVINDIQSVLTRIKNVIETLEKNK